jgi:hypothetical protein
MSRDDKHKLRELFLRVGPQIRAPPGLDADLARFGIPRPLDLADLAAGERWNYAVCMPLDSTSPLILRDNRRGRCSECNGRIQFRPNLPKRVPKLCVSCALRKARGDA